MSKVLKVSSVSGDSKDIPELTVREVRRVHWETLELLEHRATLEQLV